MFFLNVFFFKGMALFTQFWYWYPLVHYLSLSFVPTAVIGLNKDLKVPDGFTFRSNAKPSLFAYPAPIETKKEEKRTKVTATLSVANKAKTKKKNKENGDTTVDGDNNDASFSSNLNNSAMEVDTTNNGDKKENKENNEENKEKSEEKKAEIPEPDFEILKNPARVTWAQQKHITFDSSQRYAPVKKVNNIYYYGQKLAFFVLFLFLEIKIEK